MVLSTPASTLENLSRLASRPGVQSTLILSRTDGSIIRSSGLLANVPSPSALSSSIGDGPANLATEQMGDIGNVYDMATNVGNKVKRAEDVARMIFSFVSETGEFVEGMDEGDGLKLLRVRTRKNEIVIVPDSKFLLVVIHDLSDA